MPLQRHMQEPPESVGILNFVLFLPSVVLEMKGLAPSLALEACMYWHNAI